MTGEPLIFAYALCPPDPTDSLKDRQPRRDFHPGYLGYQDEMPSRRASRVLRVDSWRTQVLPGSGT